MRTTLTNGMGILFLNERSLLQLIKHYCERTTYINIIFHGSRLKETIPRIVTETSWMSVCDIVPSTGFPSALQWKYEYKHNDNDNHSQNTAQIREQAPLKTNSCTNGDEMRRISVPEPISNPGIDDSHHLRSLEASGMHPGRNMAMWLPQGWHGICIAYLMELFTIP